eukprot:CAMPEP_0185543222 /NCGR_PEP_ID=MMETSP1381-20130426/3134_1 /TAXON_ID=298111 /ORGANISM="Pavlova sp., Strain CCMP459" /LENGTH=252 /DNA_ID=CAMNT_0028155301 /DNA_START=20 /DNA_END=779 /DNA_ORIENTATION=+
MARQDSVGGRGTSHVLQPYLDCIRHSLDAALCVQNFASQLVERHNKPEIEARESKELTLNTLVIHRSEDEGCMIETSVNSVRVSIRIKQADETEEILAKKFSRFLMQRADNFVVLRRKPMEGYDISFLITNFHLEQMYKHKVVDFIVQFVEDINKEISAMKLNVNTRARLVGMEFLKEFTNENMNGIKLHVYALGRARVLSAGRLTARSTHCHRGVGDDTRRREPAHASAEMLRAPPFVYRHSSKRYLPSSK